MKIRRPGEPKEATEAPPSSSKTGDIAPPLYQRFGRRATTLKEPHPLRRRPPANPARFSERDGSIFLARISARAGQGPRRTRWGRKSGTDPGEQRRRLDGHRRTRAERLPQVKTPAATN